jgi:Protein of unknown function (DUF669)
MSMGWDFSFDFDEADEVRPFTVVPAGMYQVVISDTKIDVTKGGEAMPHLTMTIENHPEYTGSYLFDRWYMPNKGKQELKAYKKTLGFMKMRLEAIYRRQFTGGNQLDIDDLRGRRVLVQVTLKRDPQKDEVTGNDVYIDGKQQFYPEKNEVAWYFPFEQTGAQVAQQVPMGVGIPMQPTTALVQQSAAIQPQGNGGQPQPTSSPAPSPQPTPTASEPTPSVPAAAPSAPEPAAPEAPGEPDLTNTFRL